MQNGTEEPSMRIRMRNNVEKERIAAVKRVSELWFAKAEPDKYNWAELERAIDALTVAHLALSLRYPILIASIDGKLANEPS